jgi:hypothetical protein
MPGSSLAAAAAAVLALTAPAAAMAQSGAGDNQYADPFGNSGSGNPGQTKPPTTHHATPVRHPSTSGSGSAPAPTTTPAPAPVTTTAPVTPGAAPAAAASSSSTGSAGSASSSATLPRTGFDAGWEAAAGGVLLLAGLTLRAQTRRRRPLRRRG